MNEQQQQQSTMQINTPALPKMGGAIQSIGKGWGGAQNADCSGFTVAQLQTLDFAAMDLSEFYASLVPTLPNVGALQAQALGVYPLAQRCQRLGGA